MWAQLFSMAAKSHEQIFFISSFKKMVNIFFFYILIQATLGSPLFILANLCI